MHLRKSITVLVFLSALAVPFMAWAAGELKPEAREPFDKGMAAVEEQQWLVAIGYFERAQRIDERAPQILMNLGLAESMIPGRELRSLAWFRAYLAAHPNAPNANAVRKECTKLEVRIESAVRKLAEDVRRFIPQLKGSGPEIEPGRRLNSARSVAYYKVAEALAMAGDFAGAKQTARMVQDPSGLEQDYGCKNLGESSWCDENRFGAQDTLLARIVEEQAEARDFAGALDTLRLIKRKPAPGVAADSGVLRAYETLALAQAKAGDFTEAQKTIETIPEKNVFGQESLDRKFGLEKISKIKAGGAPQQRKPDSAFLAGMCTGSSPLFSRGPDMRKELYTNPTEHLKKIASRQKLDDIVWGYVTTIREMALALKVIRIGDPFSMADFYRYAELDIETRRT